MALLMAHYSEQQKHWPQQGRHIMAQYDDTTVKVYLAYRPGIGHFAAKHGYFGDGFSHERTSWIKPNFLWMMYRSQWGTIAGQEVVLVITLQRAALTHMLAQAIHSTYKPDSYASHDEWKRSLNETPVIMQWDPDYAPDGSRVERRAIQLGLRREALTAFAREWIVAIEDISTFVAEQHAIAQSGKLDLLVTPLEAVYHISDPALAQRLTISPDP